MYDAPRASRAEAVNICLLTHSPQPVVIPFHSRGEPGHKGSAGGGPVSGSVGLPWNRQPKQHKCTVSPSGGRVLQSGVWARWLLLKPLSWACGPHFLPVSSHTHPFTSVCFLSSSRKDTSCAGLGPTPMTSRTRAKSLSRVQLCDPLDCSPPGFSVHGDFPGKNTGVGCHALFQGIFLTQESNPCLLRLLYRLADSLLLAPPGKPVFSCNLNYLFKDSTKCSHRLCCVWQRQLPPHLS